MLSQTLTDRLNHQINCEFYSSNLYLQMSSWCESKGLDGCAAFLGQHADEEMGHMRRLFQYVNETGSMAVIDAIAAPCRDYEGLEELFKTTYDHECKITKGINELAEMAFDEKDLSTFNFLQWYVAEQHEEEHLFKQIVDKIDIIGAKGRGLFFIDKEIGNMARARTAG